MALRCSNLVPQPPYDAYAIVLDRIAVILSQLFGTQAIYSVPANVLWKPGIRQDGNVLRRIDA